MAKSDLLKEAIADAKAVRETALANAKLALQEAFAPRIQSMLSAKLSEELEDEEAPAELEAGMDDMEAGADELEAGMNDMGNIPTAVNVGLDFDDDGEYDLTGMVGAEDELEAGMDDMEAGSDDMEAGADELEAGMDDMEGNDAAYEDDLDLEEILRELEGDVHHESSEDMADHMTEESYDAMEGDDEGEDIDEIIEAILRETEGMEAPSDSDVEELSVKNKEMEKELAEAYRTVKQLKSVINEVNLLNAKLLYTNKLFRNFELTETQKMKVIENFDRATNTRESKLVFATLAESFSKPKVTPKRKVVKESFASKPTATTAPSKQTTQILSEGFELANRWKKLAGLI
jgi:hypothetical protein